MNKNNYYLAVLFAVSVFLYACSNNAPKPEATSDGAVVEEVEETTPEIVDPMSDKGIGPISSVDVSGEIDTAMASHGEEVFVAKCSACHKVDTRKIGPPMTGITKKRTPEWIMNMILNPEEMVQKNEAAKALLAEYIAPMANQNLEESEARALLEYFRNIDK